MPVRSPARAAARRNAVGGSAFDLRAGAWWLRLSCSRTVNVWGNCSTADGGILGRCAQFGDRPTPDSAAAPWVANKPTCWNWQFAPNGLLYPAYLAGTKESRMGTQAVYVRDYGWEWDSTLGGRIGLFRYGTDDPIYPEGWQLDIEGAAFPRLDLMLQREMRSTDFRVGVPLTHRNGPWESKLAFYHLCSHAGDQFMLDFPEIGRVAYLRDAADIGLAVRLAPNLRLYSELGWAFNATGGAKPFDLQFGAEYSSQEPTGLRACLSSRSMPICGRKTTSAVM